MQRVSQIFQVETKTYGDGENEVLAISLKGLDPQNYVSKLRSLGLVAVGKAEFLSSLTKIVLKRCDIGTDILICMGELLEPELNRKTCLAFSVREAGVWQMPIFCTYYTYFYPYTDAHTYAAGEPKEHRWIIVKKLNAN